MSKRNEAIGTVECPMKGCNERCDVFRFRERGDSQKSIANRRFAGRLYGRCTKHGRFGGDPSDVETQEYILCNASMHSAGDRQPAPAASSPATTPASLSNTKQTTPARAAPSASAKSLPRSGERTNAASSAPAKRSPSSPATTSEAPARKKSGFGFFGWEDS